MKFYFIHFFGQSTERNIGTMGLRLSMISAFLLFHIVLSTSQSVQTATYDTGMYRRNHVEPKLIQLISNRPQCRPHQACSVAVCPWHEDILDPDRQACDFLRAACTCQTGSQCSSAESLVSSTPEAGSITFNFRCVPRT